MASSPNGSATCTVNGSSPASCAVSTQGTIIETLTVGLNAVITAGLLRWFGSRLAKNIPGTKSFMVSTTKDALHAKYHLSYTPHGVEGGIPS